MHRDEPYEQFGRVQREKLRGEIAAASLSDPFILKVEHDKDSYSIQVYLDNDQLKHQPSEYPIGNRKVAKGSTFSPPCDYAWHKAATLPVIAEHVADRLRAGKLAQGDLFFPSVQSQTFSTRVDKERAPKSIDFHFEGLYLLEGKLVVAACHCYPPYK